MLLVFQFLGTSALATTILSAVADLPDEIAGDDLWQARYRVSGFDFDVDHGFTIEFDRSLYSQLELPAAPLSPDWDILVLQPDLGLPDDGIYDALALVDGASLGITFVVDFVWLGAGEPGAQPFEIYGPGFVTLEVGITTVPDPGMPLSSGAALVAFMVSLRGGHRPRGD